MPDRAPSVWTNLNLKSVSTPHWTNGITVVRSQNSIDSEDPAQLRNVPFIADRTVPISADIYRAASS